uniref:Nuclear transport factor 2 family protein n=1 Tax=Plectus sambesii TaxID=2011161 RepID=A0A914WAS2_9BILA
MYADDATLRDPDQSLIVGKNDLREYYTQHFTFSRMLGTPQMQLTSTRTQVKGEFIYDIGEYSWSAIRSGRYVHKWAWIKDDYYLISDRFTIEQMQPLFELNNDENADAGNEDMDTGV